MQEPARHRAAAPNPRPTLRAFVAVFPPPATREALLRSARALPVAGDVRWVRPENVHLTLKFLGDVPEETLRKAADALAPACARHDPFEVEPAGFGAFPSPKKARVLWAGVGAGSGELRALAADVEAALVPLGFPSEDRRYVPHMTVGRARGRPVFLDAEDERTEAGAPRFAARDVGLMVSSFDGEGVSYSTLASFSLA